MGDTVEEGTDVNENHTTEMNNNTIYPYISPYYIYIYTSHTYDIFTYIKKHGPGTCTNTACYYVKMT